MTLRTKLGYTAAGATVLGAILVPLLLMGMFSKGIVALGLRVDEMYSGGPKVRTIDRGDYSITIHQTVSPHTLQDEEPFVQLDWSPVSALPASVLDPVDIDGDGQPDVCVEFDVPSDPKAALHVDVESLNPHYEEIRNAGNENTRG